LCNSGRSWYGSFFDFCPAHAAGDGKSAKKSLKRNKHSLCKRDAYFLPEHPFYFTI